MSICLCLQIVLYKEEKNIILDIIHTFIYIFYKIVLYDNFFSKLVFGIFFF